MVLREHFWLEAIRIHDARRLGIPKFPLVQAVYMGCSEATAMALGLR